MHQPRLFAIVTLSCLFCLVPAGHAQSTFGSITGNVKDPAGSSVPAAAVQVINEDTGIAHSLQTTSSGLFDVPNLDIGTYRVRVTAAGFATYERSGMHLTANQILDVNVPLTLGATTSVIEVRSASPVITTEANDIAGSMSHEQLEAMPLVGRHDGGSGGIYTYATLTTGAATVPTSAIPVIQGARSPGGALPTMDGIAVMAYAQGAGPVQPSMEGIQELKIETSLAPAEFSTAGNFQVITKSGTNALHGGLFWDYNGNALNARNFFAAKVPFRVYNNFGGSLGGAIKKNKLFFFGDYEGSREAATITLVESVPLVPWRGGDFSGNTKPVIDPLTGKQFPGNMIPASRISPVSQKIQNYIYPLPNAGTPGVVANNWTINSPGTTGFTVFDNYDARVDYNISEKDMIFGRISWRKMPLTSPGVYPLARLQVRYGESAVFSWNHIFSPTVFNEFRFGTTYHRNNYTANVTGGDLISQFGLQGVSTTTVRTAPYFNINGVTPWYPDASSSTYQDNPETTLQWIDNVSWNHGRHFMKFGFDAIRDRLLGNNIGSSVYGEYDFTSLYTGTGYADFLLGLPQTTSLALPNPNRDLRGLLFGLYAQDQFRVNNSLTLNFGLRWELEGPYTDARGALFSFDPKTGSLVIPDKGAGLVNPLFPKNIPILTASAAHFPSNSLVNMNWKNFQPRVGFAYKPFHDGKTVVRGGYGIYGNLIYAQLARSQMSGGPFSGSVSYINALTNGTPLFSFPLPFLTSGTTSTQNVAGVNPNLRTPYTQQWNFTVEHQIGGYGLRVSYAGAKTVALVYRRNLNEPAPSLTPFSLSEYPYQRYSQISYADSGGTDAYHALELAVTKKYGSGLTVTSGFTWAKDLTDTQDSGGGGAAYGGQIIQNQFNRDIEKANNQLVVPRRFFAYAVYQLPVGRGQRFLSHPNAVVQQILGGWRTNWTAVAQAGQYFTPSFAAFGPSNTGMFGGVPDRIGDGNLSSGQTIRHWFDTSAFAVPGCPATTPVCTNPVNVGRFGNSGFNIVSAPPIRNLDFGLDKNFRVTERVQLKFNLIMANALNHPNFTAPAANISAPGTVGIISSQAKPLLSEPGPREVDFGLRITF